MSEMTGGRAHDLVNRISGFACFDSSVEIPHELVELLELIVNGMDRLDAVQGRVAGGAADLLERMGRPPVEASDSDMEQRVEATNVAIQFFVSEGAGYSMVDDVIPLARFLLGEAA